MQKKTGNDLNEKRAVCLFSGGLDSTTSLFVALREGYAVTALTINYGQTHVREIDHARAILEPLGIEHHLVTLPLAWGGSSLTDENMEIPSFRDPDPAVIPSTYVPARNMIFLSIAASLAETREAGAVFIGANAIDYSGYPDCRPEFLRAFENTSRLGTRAGTEGRGLRIEAPLVRRSKKGIVLLAHSLGVPLEKTWSCYRGEAVPCRTCDSCRLRQKGFEEAGLEDPALSHEISSIR